MKKIFSIVVATTIIALLTINYQFSSETGYPVYTADDLDINDTLETSVKKQRFFDFLRPIVIAENERILKIRSKVLDAMRQQNNQDYITILAKEYTIEWDEQKPNWEKLLERVDTVAIELALAQSANESAWGQSRFAREGNNFFGQWCYKKGCGIVPKNRSNNSHHEVAKFRTVNESVRSYIKNINTGRVYYPLRKTRRDNREAGKQPDALAQAGGLVEYSQRRGAYVKEIRNMIKENRKLMLGN